MPAEGMKQSIRKLKVFLCHSSGDKPAVRNLYQRLLSDGFQPWLDEEDLVPGQEWKVEIPKAVRESDVVIVCLSPTSINKTGYVQKEIKFALDIADEQPEGKIFIIPARIEECDVPKRLSDWQWVDLYKDNGYQKLLVGLKACVQTNVGKDSAQSQLPQPSNHSITIVEKREMVTIGGMDFTLVPKGKFLMGSRDDDPNADDDEKPQHTVDLPDYYIARFPVTFRQFKEFINATQYSYEWTEDGQTIPDHPIVNVSWRDAIAFCQWFNQKHKGELPMGLVICLPKEAEWEKAARGEFGISYPWGDIFSQNCCNTIEGGNGSTTPVGIYSPSGDSPYGATDMAGNVWEWCHSLYRPYPYQFDDGREDNDGEGKRVFRGGACDDFQRHARCAYRDRFAAGLVYSSLGFRCVLSPQHWNMHP